MDSTYDYKGLFGVGTAYRHEPIEAAIESNKNRGKLHISKREETLTVQDANAGIYRHMLPVGRSSTLTVVTSNDYLDERGLSAATPGATTDPLASTSNAGLKGLVMAAAVIGGLMFLWKHATN